MKFLAPICLFGIAFLIVIAAEDFFPVIVCKNDKAPLGACARFVPSIYPHVADALNDELKEDGLADNDVYITDYDESIALIDSGIGKADDVGDDVSSNDGDRRALRRGNERELGYCPPFCEGVSTGFCMQLCSGDRRRILQEADLESWRELEKASEVKLFELGKAIQNTDKVCGTVLKKARCSFSSI